MCVRKFCKLLTSITGPQSLCYFEVYFGALSTVNRIIFCSKLPLFSQILSYDIDGMCARILVLIMATVQHVQCGVVLTSYVVPMHAGILVPLTHVNCCFGHATSNR